MNPQTIKSYLVSLGFNVSPTQFQNFKNTLKQVGDQAKSVAATMAKDFVSAGVAVTGALISISGATLALMNNVSQADLGYQLFARRMFMSIDAAKRLKIATDALGYSLEDIIWGPPELRQRYFQLVDDQRRMGSGLGGDFESQMRTIRDVRFEFTRLRVELQYLAMGTVSALSRALFGSDDGLLKKLRALNDWLIRSLPVISQKAAQYLVPILKDTYRIGADLWDVMEKVASVFFRFIGVLSGDQSLVAGAVNMDNFGRAADHVANALTAVFDALAKVVNFIESHPKTVGTALGAAIGFRLGGVEGALVGAPLGLGAGYLYQRTIGKAQNGQSLGSEAAREAQRIAPMLGIPADVLLSQWAHETGDFTDTKARTLNNLGGVRNGSGGYRSFASLDDFGDFVARLYSSKRYSGVPGSQTPEQLAAALKAGGYYEDSYANYSAGMRRNLPYASQLLAPQIDASGMQINILQPNATPSEIQAAVGKAIEDKTRPQTVRNTVQFSGPYN